MKQVILIFGWRCITVVHHWMEKKKAKTKGEQELNAVPEVSNEIGGSVSAAASFSDAVDGPRQILGKRFEVPEPETEETIMTTENERVR